jgi:hypothetical protein
LVTCGKFHGAVNRVNRLGDDGSQNESSEPTAPHDAYRSWRELAGYFDADGTVEINVHLFTVEIRLAFDENWKPHLDGIRNFLFERGITCGAVRKKESFNTWHLVIPEVRLPFGWRKNWQSTLKKRGELLSVLRHLKSETTADEFVSEINEFVRKGERTGRIRSCAAPYTRSMGKELAHRVGRHRTRPPGSLEENKKLV